MKARQEEKRTAVDHRDRDTIGKDSTTSSRRRKDVEAGRKHRRKLDDLEREDKDHQSHAERRSRHRSRSRHSRQDHYPGSREHRDHRTEYESSRATIQPNRAYHRDHYHDHHSSRYDERSHRGHHEDETRSRRPSERDHYSSQLLHDEHNDHYHKSDHYHRESHRTESHPERRLRDNHHQSKKHKHHDYSTTTRNRRSRSREKISKSLEKTSTHPLSRSVSPHAEPESSAARDKDPRPPKHSDNQKPRVPRHLQVKKAANNSSRRLSETSDHEESDNLNVQDSSKLLDKVVEFPSDDISPPDRKPDSSNASIVEAQPSDMNAGNHTPRHGPNPLDARQQYSTHPSQYVTPNHSHHGSPHSASPYGRGGWGGGYYAQQQ